MRTIEYANAFKRDFRRTKAVPRYANTLDELLMAVLDRLVKDLPLPEANRDHGLVGNWAGFRECHLKPDLLLVYQKPNDVTLRLVRRGTHSELFD